MSQVIHFGFPYLLGIQHEAVNTLSVLALEVTFPHRHVLHTFAGYQDPALSMIHRSLRPEQIPPPDLLIYIARATDLKQRYIEYYVTLDKTHTVIGWGPHIESTSDHLKNHLDMHLMNQHRLPTEKEHAAYELGIDLNLN